MKKGTETEKMATELAEILNQNVRLLKAYLAGFIFIVAAFVGYLLSAIWASNYNNIEIAIIGSVVMITFFSLLLAQRWIEAYKWLALSVQNSFMAQDCFIAESSVSPLHVLPSRKERPIKDMTLDLKNSEILMPGELAYVQCNDGTIIPMIKRSGKKDLEPVESALSTNIGEGSEA